MTTLHTESSIRVFLSNALKQLVRIEAAKQGKQMSEYIRTLLIEKLGYGK